jgi:hypothetical protein
MLSNFWDSSFLLLYRSNIKFTLLHRAPHVKLITYFFTIISPITTNSLRNETNSKAAFFSPF